MNALRTIPKEKLKLGIWIIALVIVGLVVGQLFKGINADQLTSSTPGTPQYPTGGLEAAAINGLALMDVNSMSGSSDGLINYDCDDKGVGASVAVYPDDVTAAVLTAVTDQDCEYFANIAAGDYILCAYATDESPAKTVSEIFPTANRSKCLETTVEKHLDNFIDLNLITGAPKMEYGILRVKTVDNQGRPAPFMSVSATCSPSNQQYTGVTTVAPNSPDAKIDFHITPVTQTCTATVRDYSNNTQSKTVSVKKSPPETEVIFTVNNTPRTSFIHKLLGVETAKAAVTKKTVNRNTVKKAPASKATKPKEVSQGRIAGWVTTETGAAITAPVTVKLILVGPEQRDNVTGRPIAPTWTDTKQTDATGGFDFTPVQFTVNQISSYRIEIVSPGFEITPSKIKVQGEDSPNGQILLSKESKWQRNAAAPVLAPYKVNGVQVFAQTKDIPFIKGHTEAVDAQNPPATLSGIWRVKDPQKTYQGTQFEYKEANYPVIGSKYTVTFQLSSADAQETKIEGIYDTASGTKLPFTATANSISTDVTLTNDKKNANLIVKLKKASQPALSGDVPEEYSPGINNREGTFTVTPANYVKRNVTSFNYPQAKLNETYGVTFQPEEAGVQVEGYYDGENPSKRIDNTKIVLTEATPAVNVIVKLKKANTNLSITLTPPKDDFLLTTTLNRAYAERLKKKSQQDRVTSILDTATSFIGDKLAPEETEIHAVYKVPNKGITLAVNKKEVGATDTNAHIADISANQWVGTNPEIAAVKGTLPACFHIHTARYIKVRNPLNGKDVRQRVASKTDYTPTTLAISDTDPILGQLKAPNPEEIAAGQSNQAEIAKAKFLPENLVPTLGRKLGEGSFFFSHEQKLQRCLEGKSIETPVLTATLNPKGEVKLSEGETTTATVTWALVEADSTDPKNPKYVNDPTIKVSLEIREGDTSTISEVPSSGSKQITLRLNEKKGINYDVFVRVKGTEKEDMTKKLEVSTKHKKK